MSEVTPSIIEVNIRVSASLGRKRSVGSSSVATPVVSGVSRRIG